MILNNLVDEVDESLLLPYTQSDIETVVAESKGDYWNLSDIEILKLKDGRYIYTSKIGETICSYVSMNLNDIIKFATTDSERERLGL